MILPEKRLKELFATLPALSYEGKEYPIVFDFGTEAQLYEFLNKERKKIAATGSGNIYPLIWLQTPITKTGDDSAYSGSSSLEFDLKLVIAVLTKTDRSNLERLEISFENQLIPVLESVIKKLNGSGFTQIFNRFQNKRTDYFNYGTQNDEEHKTNDIWDAIKFECRLEITNNCFKN